MKQAFRGVQHLQLIEELCLIRHSKIDKIAAAAADINVAGHPFDIFTLIKAIAKMSVYAKFVESVIGDEAERALDIALSAGKGDDDASRQAIAVAHAVQICLTHASIVTDTIADRCMEYMHKAQTSMLLDAEAKRHPCDKCQVACDTVPAKEEYQRYLEELVVFARTTDLNTSNFLALAHGEVLENPVAARAYTMARVNTGNIAKTFIGMVMSNMRQIQKRVAEYLEDWDNVSSDDLADAYIEILAASALADGVSLWLDEVKVALPHCEQW